MAKCEHCGTEIELPFECNYCEKHFCEAHRLPENHDCAYAPPRTPLGSYQTKQMIAQVIVEEARKRESSAESRVMDISDRKRPETRTNGNIHGYRFSVPAEVYFDEKCRDKLNKARTMNEVESIVRDYRKHHKINK